MALASDGRVFVSGTVKDLVVGSGIEFFGRGSHRLKGVPGEWRLHEVMRVGRLLGWLGSC
jgi:class 3 adenylate cyclase